MYATFAKEAKEEGFNKLAKLFEMVSVIEKRHEERYNALAYDVKKKKKHSLKKKKLHGFA